MANSNQPEPELPNHTAAVAATNRHGKQGKSREHDPGREGLPDDAITPSAVSSRSICAAHPTNMTARPSSDAFSAFSTAGSRQDQPLIEHFAPVTMRLRKPMPYLEQPPMLRAANPSKRQRKTATRPVATLIISLNIAKRKNHE